MNLIPKIAEMLGVEMGEHFIVEGEDIVDKIDGAYHYFSNTELLLHIPDRKPDYAQYRTLADLIYGDKKIVKLPFEPKVGESYYWYSIADDNVNVSVWRDSTADYCYKYCGNCFRTEAEAEKHKYEIYEKLTGRKWEDEQANAETKVR